MTNLMTSPPLELERLARPKRLVKIPTKDYLKVITLLNEAHDYGICDGNYEEAFKILDEAEKITPGNFQTKEMREIIEESIYIYEGKSNE